MTDELENNTAETDRDDCPADKGERSPGRYRNPPEHSRFQNGRSRNAKGRPKREETYADLFRKELNKRICIQENGKRIRITKRRAWIKGVVNRTLQRDRNAEKTFLQIEKPTDASQVGGVDFYIIG
jgi:hypothetical protein